MLDIVKMKPVVDIHDLIEAMGEIEGLSSHDIFSELQDMNCYGGSNESYATISDEWIGDGLYNLILEEGKYDKYELIELADETLLSLVNPNTNYDKVRCKLFEMMVKEEIPRDFILLINW